MKKPDAEAPLGKVILLGNSAVGKSCIFHRFFNKTAPKGRMLPTIGVEYKAADLKVNGRDLRLRIWDTSGQEKHAAISKSFYKDAHGIMIVFSLSDRASYDQVDNWLDRVRQEAPREVAMILVGNKSDIIGPCSEAPEGRVVDLEEAKEKAKSLKIPYVEVSAKDGSMVNEAFMELASMTEQNIRGGFRAEDGVIIARGSISKQAQTTQAGTGEPSSCKC